MKMPADVAKMMDREVAFLHRETLELFIGMLDEVSIRENGYKLTDNEFDPEHVVDTFLTRYWGEDACEFSKEKYTGTIRPTYDERS